MNASHKVSSRNRIVDDPGIAKFLFTDTRSSVIWLVLRVWLGLQWWDAGLHKVQDPTWVTTGTALKSFWERIIVVPQTGRPTITFDWYRDFIKALLDGGTYSWFAPLVAWGEVLVAVALIVGAFVGIAAFFGSFMNWNFIMAGSASSNGLLMALTIPLVLAWKVAGYIGADYFLLRWLGVPWRLPTAQDKVPGIGASPAK